MQENKHDKANICRLQQLMSGLVKPRPCMAKVMTARQDESQCLDRQGQDQKQ